MIEITKDTITVIFLMSRLRPRPFSCPLACHCLGCPSSRGETVEEACMVHGIDCDKLLEIVNEEANKAAE